MTWIKKSVLYDGDTVGNPNVAMAHSKNNASNEARPMSILLKDPRTVGLKIEFIKKEALKIIF